MTTDIDQLPPVAKRPSIIKRFAKNPTGVVAFVIFATIVLLCVFAPLFTQADPIETSFMNSLLPFGSPDHPFGSDGVGRDILARLLYGGRTSISAAVVAVSMAAVIGVPLGLVAGYYQGKIDLVLSWVTNVLMSLPGILVLLIIISIIGTRTYLSMMFFGIMMSPSVFRLIRSQATSVREELYVDAARVAGIKDARIIRRHILPVVVQPSIIQLSLLMGVGIMVQAGIEFLGFGDPDRASWGSMLLDAFQNLYLAPSLIIYPSVALVLTIVSLGLIGNALRDTVGAGIVKKSVDSDVSLLDTAPREGVHSVAKQPAAGEAVLDVENLSVGYKKPDGSISVVVDNVNLTVSKGEVLGLVGESGSGKTQTAFAIMRLLPKSAIVSAKRIGFCGIDLKELGKREFSGVRGMRIAYIPQEPMSNLDPSFTVGSQLVGPMRRHLGLSKKNATVKAMALLERVGINDPERVFHAYPHQISGGMAQRVLIAGAVSCEPDLLIADEPTTALDVTVQAEVLDLMRSLQAEYHMGMILVTHNFGVVADICDRVAVMQYGRIVEMKPARELFKHPEHQYTKDLLASTLEDCEPRPALESAR